MIPTARIYLIIHDVGPRGGEVAVNLAADGVDLTRSYMAANIDDAADRLKPILRRLMYGADQPDDEKPPG